MADAARNDLTIYDTAADGWWSDETRWVRTLRNLVPARLRYFDRFVDWRGLRVLDLGCAGGFMAEALHDRGAIVYGIDPAGRAIDAARRHAVAAHKPIEYRVGVGEDLPYDDGAFDAVVCVDVLEHVASLDGTVREISRVLKPGGWLLFDTINRNPLARFLSITLAEELLGVLPRGTHDPDLFIRPAELEAELRSADLVPGPVTGLGPWGLNRRGDLVFGTVPTTAVIYIGTARKPSRPEPVEGA